MLILEIIGVIGRLILILQYESMGELLAGDVSILQEKERGI